MIDFSTVGGNTHGGKTDSYCGNANIAYVHEMCTTEVMVMANLRQSDSRVIGFNRMWAKPQLQFDLLLKVIVARSKETRA